MKVLILWFLVGFWIHTSMAMAEKNILAQTQSVARSSLKAERIRMRVSTENMANSDSIDYTPREVILQGKYDPRLKTNKVHVKRIMKARKKMKKVYEPDHPMADKQGYVTKPDVNPLIDLINVQDAKNNYQRSLKVHEMIQDTRQRGVGLIQR